MRRSPLRARPPVDHSGETGYREWKAPVFGECSVCGERGRLERHHVILEQHLRAWGAPVYDLRCSMLLGMYCRCHRDQTSAAARIPVSKVPAAAIAYAVELLGEARAADYMARYYAAG